MFAQRLKSLRKNKKLTQSDMANMLGITRQGYAKYENDESEPDLATIDKLAEFFNVTTDYLLGRSDIMNPRLFENAGITNQEYLNLSAYQKEVVDFFLTRENLQFYDRPKRLLDALEQFEIFYEYWKKQQEQKDEE
ncbi:helix-turn-helix domain-containing protein [Rummeliibacillus sp. POC4]|uniref:helix-turn-helix domain-containing protein n=1 Tax=Rummeliibacillus sp. POC4 TaxID=2305899 RepID=UPI000E66F2CD|nr:helix-turn-helix transcriptional regulator [Rummeliibacillus sp. POC4]RIJ63118.1 XRE family transcriptional regulator [Rummeliibacillus sp. POC4]